MAVDAIPPTFSPSVCVWSRQRTQGHSTSLLEGLLSVSLAPTHPLSSALCFLSVSMQFSPPPTSLSLYLFREPSPILSAAFSALSFTRRLYPSIRSERE